jgi:lysozyme family protein
MTGSRVSAREAINGAQFIDDMPKPVQIVMDTGCDIFGTLTCIKLLQRAAGLPITGVLTRNQAVAIAGRPAPEIVAKVLTEWSLYRMGSRYFDEKGRGWLNGLFQVALDIGALPAHVTSSRNNS